MNLTLRNKLLILTLAPLLLAVIMGSVVVYQAGQDRSKALRAADNLSAMKAMSQVLAGIQNERGVAFLYLDGAAGADQIMSTRFAVDQSWESGKPVLMMKSLPEGVLAATETEIEGLAQLRRSVDERSVTAESAYKKYSQFGDVMIAQMVVLSMTDAAEASRQLESIVLYEKAKENAGRVQCLTSSIFTQDASISYQAILELVNTNSGISVNLDNGTAKLGENIAIAVSELELSVEWYFMQNAVIEILGLASAGGYGRDGLEFYKETVRVATRIQSIIDTVVTQTETWFELRSAKLGREIVLIASLLGVSVLFVLLVSIFMLSNVSGRIKEVSIGMKNVSSGDADLTRRIESKASDELGQLSGYFNDFVSMLKGIIDRVKAEVHSLSDGMIQLSSNTEETAGAIRQITANIESLKIQSVNQSSSVTESSNTVELIARNIVQLYKLIEKQADGVSSSSSAIEQMVASIQSVTGNIERMGSYYEKLLGKSDSGRGAIETVGTQIKEIDAQSENLEEANSLIAGIAAQTNLLAMNAAIEAAHAGEAGQGFAVVADEIRKLAENAATQSKTIARNIKGIRATINAVVSSSSLSARTFEEMLEQIRILSRLEEEIKYSMQEQSAGSVLILQSLASINDVTADVRQSAQEMQDGSNTVLLEMRRLLQLSSELENGMSEMAAGAEEIRRAAQDTNDLSITAARSVQAVATEMTQFKT